MVPVILPFVRAEVSAGTAKAARIAMIAITTSNSMSVNAEKNFFTWIFMWVLFSAGCSEGSHVSARALLRGLRGFVLGFFVLVWVWGLFRGYSEMRGYRSLHG